MKADEKKQERCKSCGRLINEEDLIVDFEDRGEFKGREEVVVGYRCIECNYMEVY